MKLKGVLKLSADILMTAGLFFLMGYQFWGEALHEWVGAGMLILFILHHILNHHWHKNLFKGRYSAKRILTLCIDCLLLLLMVAQMYSGIVMSRYVFDFLPIDGGMALARQFHILGTYWGFLLMSLHLGLHWNMILGTVLRAVVIKQESKIRTWIASSIGVLIAGYGVYAFIKRDFTTYMFLKSQFVFLDYSEAKLSFYIDYIAIMGFCVMISHYGAKIIKRIGHKKQSVNKREE